jgi:predicted TPR repeat methyltransferase
MEAANRAMRSSGDLLADRRYGFALALAERGDREGAADLLAQAVEIAPLFASGWFALGELREALGDPDGARAAFARAQAADPDDVHGAGLRLARLGTPGPDGMSAGYVRTLFDQYAVRFDTALQNLEYRGPALLLAALERTCKASGRPLRFGRVLDLGCGTGLAGAAIRPLCDWLAGVDASSGMIAQARQKQIYDELAVDDVAAFLRAQRHVETGYDSVLAADVCPYFSDLAPILAAVAPILSAHALVGFTVETHAGLGVRLGEKLRYAHGEDHVCGAVAAAGLTLQSIDHAAIRTEAGNPVPALIVVAAAG